MGNLFPDSSTHAPCGFHMARTLSGSLRSPPSPRGEGFDAGKTVFSFRCLPHGGRWYSHFSPLRRISPLSFIPPEPSPPLRGTFPGGLTIRGKPAIADLRASPDLYCGEAATTTLNLEPFIFPLPSKKEPAFAGSFYISTIYFLLKA